MQKACNSILFIKHCRSDIMRGKIITFIGFLGVIATLIVAVTTFSSKDLLCVPFIVVGVLLSIIIVALGEIIQFIESNQNNGGTKNEKSKI